MMKNAIVFGLKEKIDEIVRREWRKRRKKNIYAHFFVCVCVCVFFFS